MPETASPAAGTVEIGRRPFDASWRAPILISILGPIAWLVFTLLYVGFWASGLTLFQDVVVVLVSVLVLGGVMAGVWTLWGSRRFGFDRPWK